MRSAGFATAAPKQPDPNPAASLTPILSVFVRGEALCMVVLKIS